MAKVEGALPHQSVKGRMRELLVDEFLAPWLPPSCGTGTGTIIDGLGGVRPHTQDDVVIYDRDIMPVVLGSHGAKDGVFPFNSVLMRLEVKSTIRAQDVRDFVESSRDLATLRLIASRSLTGPINMLLFGFNTDLKDGSGNDDLARLTKTMVELSVDATSGVVAGICVAGRGFWKLCEGGGREWRKARRSVDELDDLVVFLGCVSNTCFVRHAERQGRDPRAGCESGIGAYLPGDFDPVL
jgi:hypothetical protein